MSAIVGDGSPGSSEFFFKLMRERDDALLQHARLQVELDHVKSQHDEAVKQIEVAKKQQDGVLAEVLNELRALKGTQNVLHVLGHLR